MSLILASGSPRRRELLTMLGLRFTVKTADIDEAMDPALPPEEETARVSRRKAAAVQKNCLPGDLILAADTIVVIDGAVLGKPGSPEEAAAMLRRLSGRTHTVHTAVTLLRDETVLTEVDSTSVTFRPLSEEDIRNYIATGEPMDKAGAYGIQSKGALFAERISGDYYTVMGLPVCRLGKMLRRFGVALP